MKNWTHVKDMLTSRNDFAAAVARDKHGTRHIYVFGGSVGSTRLDDVESYNPCKDSWVTRKSMLSPRSDMAAAESGGKIYLFGGSEGIWATDTVEVYDPKKDDWESLDAMPMPRRNLAAVTESGGKYIYIFGGESFGPYDPRLVDRYEPASKTWQKSDLAVMPRRRDGLAATRGFPGKKIYIFGGAGSATIPEPKDVDVFDPGAAQEWPPGAAPLPTARAGLGAASGRDGRVYAIGGRGQAVGLNAVESHDPVANSWTDENPLTGRGGLAVTRLGPYIYAMGGYSKLGGGILKKVERFGPLPGNILSLALAGTVDVNKGLVAVDSDGRLLGKGWSAIDTWGRLVEPYSLISGENRVFGVLTTGEVFNTYADNKFGILQGSPTNILPESLALGGAIGKNVGLFSVDSNFELKRAWWWKSTWNWETIATPGVAPGSLISGEKRVFGVLEDTKEVFNSYSVNKFAVLPGSPKNIEPGSLALGGTVDENVGLFSVDSNGRLRRAWWANNTWNWKIVTAHKVVPGSLISGDKKVFGVLKDSGRIFNTYGVSKFAVLPGSPKDIEPGSLALGGTAGLFAVNSGYELVRAWWANSKWNWEKPDTGVYRIKPDSLISAKNRIYGLLQDDTVFTADATSFSVL